jgi:hypothetical protein
LGGLHGAELAVKEQPDFGAEVESEVLEQVLGDAVKLHVAVVGEHLATDESSVALGFHVKVLVP